MCPCLKPNPSSSDSAILWKSATVTYPCATSCSPSSVAWLRLSSTRSKYATRSLPVLVRTRAPASASSSGSGSGSGSERSSAASCSSRSRLTLASSCSCAITQANLGGIVQTATLGLLQRTVLSLPCAFPLLFSLFLSVACFSQAETAGVQRSEEAKSHVQPPRVRGQGARRTESGTPCNVRARRRCRAGERAPYEYVVGCARGSRRSSRPFRRRERVPTPYRGGAGARASTVHLPAVLRWRMPGQLPTID